MKLKAITGNRVVKLASETFRDWMEDKALRLSAALAYYSVFSIAPLLVIAISVAGLAFGMEAVKGQLDDQLKSIIGARAAEAVQSMVQSASKPREGWIGTVTGFAILLLGASGVFGQLKDALNTIWEVQAKGSSGVMGFIRERLLNFGMVLVIGFLLLTSLVMTTAIAALNKYLGGMLGIPAPVWAIIAFVISFAMVTALFALIFKVLPDAKVQWRNVWVGAAVTAVLFEIGKFALGYYLGRESTASSYGAAASVVLLLLWVYYTSCILLFGAEFTQVYAKATGHAIEPSAAAVAIAPEKRAQEGLSPAPKADGTLAVSREHVRTIPVPAREPGSGLEPLGALLLTTAASFLAGLALRRWEKKEASPQTKLREGVSELGADALAELAQIVQKTRKGIKKRWSA
jgi:membrane protein